MRPARQYITDPERFKIPLEQVLSKEYAARRRALIDEQALLPEPGERLIGGTVYLCATDEQGMMVSLIQSIADNFGSHVVVPGTGIPLQNRAACRCDHCRGSRAARARNSCR